MSTTRPPVYAFNRGEVSKHALGRVDVDRLRLAAEIQENFLPFVVGPMMLRPGWQYCGGINDDLAANVIEFVFATDDTALIECTDSVLRVWNVDDDASTETLVTRVAVSTTVENGNFNASAGWSLTATGSGAVATVSGGKLNLASPATGGLAQAKAAVTVGAADQAKEHAFRIVVDRGPVIFRLGTTDGDDNLISETTLGTGVHSLAFTPGVGTVYPQLETRSAQTKIVDQITVEAAGVMELPTSWAAADLDYLRFDQSGDIVYVACRGQQQRKIERRATGSWSFVRYQADDGPFQSGNVSDITLTPSVLTGNGTLTASRNLFRDDHVGALFRLFSSGQAVSASLTAENTFTTAIRVTGVDAARIFNYVVTGTWTATLTIQRSFDSATAGFADVSSFTANVNTSLDDGFDNSIAWYRIGIKTGGYTSGTAVINVNYVSGGFAGVGRVVGYTSRTVVDIEVLSAFSSLSATADWNEGDWSDVAGWPSAVRFYDGRLNWLGRGRQWGSASDNFTSFTMDGEGDSAPINRNIGAGAVDNVNWVLGLNRLIAGRDGAATSIRASNLDEPISSTNFTFKDCSSKGAAAVPAVKIDTEGFYVEKSARRLYGLVFSPEKADYVPVDLTRLNLDIGLPGFEGLSVAQQPDNELLLVLGSGELACLLHDGGEQADAWWRQVSDGASGTIERIAVLPGALEDRRYAVIKRTVNGATKRFLEKLARRDQCEGLPEARLADSHVIYSGVSTTSIPVAHLEGCEVVIWGWNSASEQGDDCGTGRSDDGASIETVTVTGGVATSPNAYTNFCVGLPYTARFKSAKLAYAALMGTALLQKKQATRIGLMLLNTHHKGIEYGQSFTRMDRLPAFEGGAEVAAGTVHEALDSPMTTLPGEWDTDARLCLRATSPRPCMVAAAVLQVSTNEK